MKKNNYNLENGILTLSTECGEFKFRIDESTGPAKAERIADLMVSEMEKIQARVQAERDKSSPYAKLLLANLNLSDKYIRLEDQYRELQESLERKQAILESLKRSQEQALPRKTVTPSDPPESTQSGPGNQTSSPTGSTAPEQPQSQAQDKPQENPVRSKPQIDPPGESLSTPGPTEPPKPEQAKPEQTQPDPSEQKQPGHEAPRVEEAKQEPPILQRPHPGPLVQQVLDRIKVSKNQPTPPQTPSAQSPSGAAAPSAQGPTREDAMGSQTTTPSHGPKIHTRPVLPAAQPTNTGQRGKGFMLPSLDFLRHVDNHTEVNHEAIRRDAELLEQKLGFFGIKGEVMEVLPGPVITTFEYKPAPGIKISKIVNLADDLALALSALSIRIVAPIPGKDVIGVEIPNPKMSIVPFYDIVASKAFVDIDSPAPICLGKDIIGNPVVVGLEKMPHLLIAGATGTGKSVALNAMIASILYKSTPDQVKFIMVDPKRIELSLFNDIPHLITPVITDMKKANIALQWVVREMERRYEKLARFQVRNIEQYNEKIKAMDPDAVDEDGDPHEDFPYIVVIIDELADLMMTASKDIEFSLTRIAQMARAAGIHLILATQRPSVDVLTGIIKANFPTRISFQVSSKTDSRTIIDANGAESLLGRGDMLFVPPGTARLTRVHGTYMSETELLSITDFLKAQGKPKYLMDVITEKDEEASVVEFSDDEYDEKYEAALEFVIATRQASISGVQRALRVGYNRAARIIDLMEKRGVVGPSDGVKPRPVLVDRMENAYR